MIFDSILCVILIVNSFYIVAFIFICYSIDFICSGTPVKQLVKFSFKVIHIAKSSSTLNKVLYCIVLHYIRSIFWCSRAASCVFKNSCFGLTYACIIFEPRLVGFSSVCNISFTIAYVQLLSSKISTRRELATKQRLPMSLFGELGTTISI